MVVSGLPGSGKSTLALRLAPLLGLPVIDKDDVLERLFDSRGVGDAVWRRTLSRQSDAIFRQECERSHGAVLVSHWHLPGMAADSGTPCDWLRELSSRIVNLHCECPAELAAARFIQRKRHPGHLDKRRSDPEILASIQSAAMFALPDIAVRVSVDTSAEIDFEELADKISKALE